METLREKITFVLAALVYLVFHLRLSSSLGAMFAGTVEQLLTTAPYCIGFTWILVIIIRALHNGKKPAWDRIVRIYLTIGICFGFYFALYDYSDQAQQHVEQNRQQYEQSSSANH